MQSLNCTVRTGCTLNERFMKSKKPSGGRANVCLAFLVGTRLIQGKQAGAYYKNISNNIRH